MIDSILDDNFITKCGAVDMILDHTKYTYLRTKVHPELLRMVEIYRKVDDGSFFDKDKCWREEQERVYNLIVRDFMIRELIKKFKAPEFSVIMDNHSRLVNKSELSKKI